MTNNARTLPTKVIIVTVTKFFNINLDNFSCVKGSFGSFLAKVAAEFLILDLM